MSQILQYFGNDSAIVVALPDSGYFLNGLDISGPLVVFGGLNDDTVILPTNNSENIVLGNEGDDILVAFALSGGYSDNYLRGGDGNDSFITGGNTFNELYGDDGDDVFSLGGSFNLVEGGRGDDLFTISSLGSSVFITDFTIGDILDLSELQQDGLEIHFSAEEELVTITLGDATTDDYFQEAQVYLPGINTQIQLVGGLEAFAQDYVWM